MESNPDYLCSNKNNFRLKNDLLKSNGLSSSLLLSEFKSFEESLTCPICMKLLIDPICCSTCHYTMCKNCCESWLKVNNTCPNKCEEFNEEPLNRFAMALLSNIKLSCLNKECKKVLSYDGFSTHYSICDYTEVNCKYCNKEILNKDTTKHISECGEIPVKCEECKLNLKNKDLKFHKDVVHSISGGNSKCKYCGLSIKENLMISHLSICELLKEKTDANPENKESLVINKEKIQEYELEIKKLKEQIRLLAFRNENLTHDLNDMLNLKEKNVVLKSKTSFYRIIFLYFIVENENLTQICKDLEDEINNNNPKSSENTSCKFIYFIFKLLVNLNL